MTPRLFFVLWILFVLSSSCVKTEDVSSTGVQGIWKLTDIICSDPDDVNTVYENYSIPGTTEMVINFVGRSVAIALTSTSCTPNSFTWTGTYTIPSVAGSNTGKLKMSLSGSSTACDVPLTEAASSVLVNLPFTPDGLFVNSTGLEWINNGTTMLMDFPSHFQGDSAAGSDSPAKTLACFGKFEQQ